MNYEAHQALFTETIIPNASNEYLQELKQEYSYQNDDIERAIYQAVCKKIKENSKT